MTKISSRPLREVAHDLRLHREQHAHLQDADAVAAQRRVVQAQFEEALAQVVVGLAGGDDAEPGVGVVEHDVVELVGRRVALGHLEPARVQRLLHLERLGAHVHAEVHVRREGLAVEHQVGRDEVQPLRIDVGRAAAVGHVGDDLQADPQPRQARHHVAVQAEVEDLLHVAWDTATGCRRASASARTGCTATSSCSSGRRRPPRARRRSCRCRCSWRA